MATRWHFPRKKARRVILSAFPICCGPNLGFLLIHSTTLLEPALLATNVARAEANALNLARCGTLFALLWNVVMEHCVRLLDKDEAKHKRGDTQLSLTATIFYEATEEDHDARSTHPFEGTDWNRRQGTDWNRRAYVRSGGDAITCGGRHVRLQYRQP